MLQNGICTQEWWRSFEEKTSSTDASRAKIRAITDALKAPDEQLIDALLPLVDLEAFATFWAFEVLLTHGDGYANDANNFFVYFDPGPDKAYFMIWGVDKTFVEAGKFFGNVFASTALPHRLYNLPAGQALYVEAMRKLLDEVWDEAAILAEIDRMEALIGSAAAMEPWTGDPKYGETDDFPTAVLALRDFVATRRAQIQPVIDNPPSWDKPMLACSAGGADNDAGADPGKDTGTAKCVDGDTYEKDGVTHVCENGEWVTQ